MIDLDRKAFETLDIVTESLADFSHEGINYGEITRWFLWDKIGRYNREKFYPDHFAFELECLRRYEINRGRFVFLAKLRELAKSFLLNFKPEKISTEFKAPARSSRNKVVFVPFPTTHIRGAGHVLNASGHVLVTNKKSTIPEFSEATVISSSYDWKASRCLSSRIFAGVIQCLKNQDVILEGSDRTRLYNQLVDQQRILAQAEAEISRAKPDLMLLVADNFTPYQEYASVATKHGIPTMSFQHGLDCERYYLDQAYSSHYCVWSQTRYDQYRAVHPVRPMVLQVTGNPGFDTFSHPQSIDTDGKYWLWVSRPHKPKYCYAPTRRPYEGVEIFKALIQALRKHPAEKLVVKPHQNDYSDIYRKIALESDCADRILITDENLRKLIPVAKLVVSEDSTAGVEAMFFGKVIVHAHFAKCAPVLKLTEFHSALPGFSPEQLSENIGEALTLSAIDKRKMLEGQRACLDYYAGPLDGMSSYRQKKFILDTLENL